MFSTKVRIFLLAAGTLLWLAAGLYAIFVNALRMEQYRLVLELRELRKENDELYWKISRVLNYERALEFARSAGMVPVKPYRVANFYPTLKNETLVDFYTVWFGDRPSTIAEKLGVPLKELVRF